VPLQFWLNFWPEKQPSFKQPDMLKVK
jgi:hypothetical protein